MKCTNCSAEIEADSKFCVVCGKPVAPSAQIRIGRDDDCDIVVNHERISRLHAVMTREGAQYRITDQNSMNGIMVNGQKVNTALVQPGDGISLGGIANLDWNAILAAFSRRGISTGIYPASQPAPVFYNPEPPPRKRSPALLITLITLGVAGLLAGAYFLFGDSLLGGPTATHSVKTEYTYTNRPGEESEMSARRSLLETMENLLAKAPAELNIENSLPLAYCLLSFNVGEPQTMQSTSATGEGGKILRTASFFITDKEFDARRSYLQSRPEHLDRIREAEALLAQRKVELMAAEAQLVLASKGPQVKSLVNELFRAPDAPNSKAPLDSLPLIDNSMAESLRVYEAALGDLEGVYDSLKSIKEELSSVKTESKGKGGRTLK